MNDTHIKVEFPTFTILFFVFLVLKLTHVIAWSWWWVFAPIWLPVLLVLGFFLLMLLAAVMFGR